MNTRKHLLTNLLLLSLSTIATLAGAEFMLALFLPQNLSGQWFELDPGGYMVNRSHGSTQHQIGDRRVQYHFEPPHLRHTPGGSGKRILVLGDSFTFGAYLRDDDTVVSGLQRQADKQFGVGAFEFLNGGTGGWGTAQYLAFLEDYGDELNPDLVLVLINTDDIGRTLKADLFRINSATGTATRRPGSRTKSRLKAVLNEIPFYGWVLEHSHLVQLIRQGILRIKYPASSEETGVAPGHRADPVARGHAISLGQALFRRLAEWCQLRGTTLVVTTTGWHQEPYVVAQPADEPTRAFMSEAKVFFAAEGIPFYDPSPSMSATIRDGWSDLIIQGRRTSQRAGVHIDRRFNLDIGCEPTWKIGPRRSTPLIPILISVPPTFLEGGTSRTKVAKHLISISIQQSFLFAAWVHLPLAGALFRGIDSVDHACW